MSLYSDLEDWAMRNSHKLSNKGRDEVNNVLDLIINLGDEKNE